MFKEGNNPPEHEGRRINVKAALIEWLEGPTMVERAENLQQARQSGVSEEEINKGMENEARWQAAVSCLIEKIDPDDSLDEQDDEQYAEQGGVFITEEQKGHIFEELKAAADTEDEQEGFAKIREIAESIRQGGS